MLHRSTGMVCRSKNMLRAAEPDRPDVAARRMAWRAAQPFDVTGASTEITRLHGCQAAGFGDSS